MKLLDLFSGIGGFSLGLERSGYFETVAFCEIEPYCRAVLAKHWPKVPCYDDIRTLTADRLKADGIAVDAICGGFPCQDVSVAGRRAGMDGTRSGLWTEYSRLIGELRPQFVIVENTPGLLSLGMGGVLADLAALGYDAEWHCIPASAVGAPHRRDRVWIIAHSDQQRTQIPAAGQLSAIEMSWGNGAAGAVADTYGARLQERLMLAGISAEAGQDDNGENVALGSWWVVEPDVGRVAHGVRNRVDRLRALGNAVVPQIPELIGRAIGETL